MGWPLINCAAGAVRACAASRLPSQMLRDCCVLDLASSARMAAWRPTQTYSFITLFVASGSCGYNIHDDHLEWPNVKEQWDKMPQREKDR